MPTLDWLNRDAAFRLAEAVPTRVLRPHTAGHAYGDGAAGSGNLLIQGDNLQALKALLPFYRGRVKCIFIDPPYNTKSAFEHYDDNLEHSQWLRPGTRSARLWPRLAATACACATRKPWRRWRRRTSTPTPWWWWPRSSAAPKEIEQSQVGAVWAERSGGRALFARVYKQDRGMTMAQQIQAALA